MIENEQPALAASLWTTTAAPGPEAPALSDEVEADLCVVGGGFTGLSTALHAAEAGLNVVLVEAESLGWGASGRNGGQVLPGLKENPREVEARFGSQGARMIECAGAAPDLVFDLIERHGISCGAMRAGWISAAMPDGLTAARDRGAQWRALGADVCDLSGPETREMLGGGYYAGALWDRRGGGVQPLSYARGLAHAAVSAGVRLYARTPARNISHDGQWRIETPSGRVSAQRVALCTNGYSGPLLPELQRNVVPVVSIQIATDRLPRDIAPDILPQRQVVSDTRRQLIYFRRDAEGRFVIGGAGAHGGVGLSRAFRRLEAEALRLFPQLGGLAWHHGWGGRVAVTTDHLPHLAEPAPGLFTAAGFNGRGLAMATMMGRILGRRLAGDAEAAADWPLEPLRRIPLHRFHRLGVRAVIATGGLRDRLRIP